MAGRNKNVGEVMAKLSPEVEALIKRYEEAQINLVNIIATQEARGNLTTYRKSILAGINQELKLLNEYSAKWANDNIPKAYETGAEETYAAFRAKNIAVGKVALNEKVVNKLVNNTIGQLKDATDFVGRRIDDDIRKAGLEAIANKTATGSTVKEAKANLINRLTDKGITAIRDKRGREINLDAYASTVARTTTAEATNKAAIQTVEDLGYDLVKITQHFSSCPVCAVYEGRVYSVSGKSKDYPPLDEAFKGGYSTIHPNCTHRAVPYFPQYDDNAEELKKASNKPFNVDNRSKASIEAYNRQQAIKTARRNDRNEWEQAKLAAPNETPRTFSGFRSMKKADGDKYKAIKEKL